MDIMIAADLSDGQQSATSFGFDPEEVSFSDGSNPDEVFLDTGHLSIPAP